LALGKSTKSAAPRVQRGYALDGSPVCPEHDTKLREGKCGLYCPHKDKASGEYCKLKFLAHVQSSCKMSLCPGISRRSTYGHVVPTSHIVIADLCYHGDPFVCGARGVTNGKSADRDGDVPVHRYRG